MSRVRSEAALSIPKLHLQRVSVPHLLRVAPNPRIFLPGEGRRTVSVILLRLANDDV